MPAAAEKKNVEEAEITIEDILRNTTAGKLYSEYSAACESADPSVRKAMGKATFRMARDGMSPVASAKAWLENVPVLDAIFLVGSLTSIGLAGKGAYTGVLWAVSKFRGA
jgi:hypothetical protein